MTELGYTSKAELIRELLCEKILELNLIKHDFNALDRHINAKMNLEDTLSELKKLALSSEKVQDIVNESRNELEEIMFNEKEADS